MFDAIFSLFFLAFVSWWIRGKMGRPPKSFQKHLQILLDQCVEKSILSAEQRNQVLQISEPSKSAMKLTATKAIASFAGLFIVAGVSLIIAHNWEQVPAIVRIAAYLLAYVALGEGLIRLKNRKSTLAIALELAWFVFPFLGIGLYAQTFQLSGDPIRPFLLWLVLVLPLVWLTEHSFIGWIYTAALWAILFVGNYESGRILNIDHAQLIANVNGLAWFLSLIMLGLAFVLNRRFMPKDHRWHVLGLYSAWILSITCSSTPFSAQSWAWNTILAMSLATLCITIPLFFSSSGIGQLTGGLFWTGIIYMISFTWHSSGIHHSEWNDSTKLGSILILTFVVAAAMSIFFAPLKKYTASSRWALSAKGILFVSLLTAVGLFSSDRSMMILVSVVANLVLFGLALLLIFHGALYQRIGEINAGLALLLLVLITRFIDVFGSFLQSGVGLIGAGVLLALLAYATEKGRKKLISISMRNSP